MMNSYQLSAVSHQPEGKRTVYPFPPGERREPTADSHFSDIHAGKVREIAEAVDLAELRDAFGQLAG